MKHADHPLLQAWTMLWYRPYVRATRQVGHVPPNMACLQHLESFQSLYKPLQGRTECHSLCMPLPGIPVPAGAEERWELAEPEEAVADVDDVAAAAMDASRLKSMVKSRPSYGERYAYLFCLRTYTAYVQRSDKGQHVSASRTVTHSVCKHIVMHVFAP